MAGNHRQTPDALERIAELEQNPERYTFVAAVRLLDAAFRESPNTGTAERPIQERFRIGQLPSLTFAPSSIAGFEFKNEQGVWNLLTHFLGMFGPNGPLPTHITEYAQMRIAHHKDPTLARFSDIFHHRMATFFYRAWAAGQPAIQLDRPESDRFAQYVASLCGYGDDTLRERSDVPDAVFQFFSGHFANARRNASSLVSILRSFFKAGVEVEQFIGHWVDLPADGLWNLGKETNGRLGEDICLGNRILDCHSRFRVILGPLSLKQYHALLPNGISMSHLQSLLRSYAGLELTWEVRLKLQKSEIPQWKLGSYGSLGWSIWLHSLPPTKDGDQLVVMPSTNSL